ncbi:Cas10/Cmr2 second palm domain-containing protein [Anthocerotibacter panamensis]|uniref:Cas10/Cmr2 second palm domain-containing protein n=1 Tax=Anthocerotibacter panamensis TaxID=2857077 RepID=UPI001C4048B4|nr:type III-B CRISPR-associated protein Cas10/Cmr2 [Anthocerotibacter panamensis]
MVRYTAITFAPVQGFIEKSRKLRDLFGASLVLSYLSFQIVQEVEREQIGQVISPGGVNIQKGMPNRLLVKGEVPEHEVQKMLSASWWRILEQCRTWIEGHVPDEYHWEEEWKNWGHHAWEIFCGHGDTIAEAMNDLETRKLRRQWTALNWTGESSSITGADAVAWPGLGKKVDPRERNYTQEKRLIRAYYERLAAALEETTHDVQGKFLSPEEQLSIPELVKRLVTREQDIARALKMETLTKSFTDIYRRPEKGSTDEGRWTGWFMGDGDRVGEHLTKLAEQQDGEAKLREFSVAMRKWGKKFTDRFSSDLGRVVYAGGDDFLGVLYRPQDKESLTKEDVLAWLLGFAEKWGEHGQKRVDDKPLTVSMGFVWVAPRVPQRDVLQHCREAEKRSKSLGRDRVTLRVVFNSGQYVQWTCPWGYLPILNQYRDRAGVQRGKDANWSHVYKDLAQLKARHGIVLDETATDDRVALALFGIYFGKEQREYLSREREELVGSSKPGAMNEWINDLIQVGWQLCSST